MTLWKRIPWPVSTGLLGAALLFLVYFGIVSLAESSQHALEYFWQHRAIVLPMTLGFGVQIGLYIILKKRLFIPVANPGSSGAMTSAGGTTSALAMAACCAHHVTDVLPILGLSAATAFIGQYRSAFMFLGLGTTLVGIVLKLGILQRERRKYARYSLAHRSEHAVPSRPAGL